jgi:transcriptional regulator with XRE-family HTH domain
MARPAYERVGNAFRLAYERAGLRQEDVAAALHVDQGTVSRWARGLQKLDLDYFPQIDELCGQPHGYLLRLAGYVDDGYPDDIDRTDDDQVALWNLKTIPEKYRRDFIKQLQEIRAEPPPPSRRQPKPTRGRARKAG